MDNVNQPFEGYNSNVPGFEGQGYGRTYDGELQEPFSTDIHGNPNVTQGQQRISRNGRYANPNDTVGAVGDPVFPLLILIVLFAFFKFTRRVVRRRGC